MQMLKNKIKSVLRRGSYRVINSQRRWGVDPYDDILKIIGESTEIKLIFDVGANVGTSAIEFMHLFPASTVHSFEPVSATFEQLKVATKSSRQIIPVNIALGDVDGMSEIYIFGDSGTPSLVGVMSDSLHKNPTGSEEIRVSKLDTYVAENGIKKIDLLKIDTEGFDLKVLNGANDALGSSMITFIVCEFHYLLNQYSTRNLCSLQELADYLSALQYRFISCYTDSVHCSERLGTYNVLFMSERHCYSWQP